MIEAIIGACATIAVGILALVQWLVSERNAKRKLEAEKRENDKLRDVELTEWGMRVIAMMAELESHCAPIGRDIPFDSAAAERLGCQASALADQGRLFFPNVEVPNTERGYRVKLLDEVLRASYVAQYLAYHGRENAEVLRAQVWSARTRFVRLLQKEMQSALVPVQHSDAGVSIPVDPTLWPAPQFTPRVLSYFEAPRRAVQDLAVHP